MARFSLTARTRRGCNFRKGQGAIAKARRWVEDLRLGRIASFAEIAEREALGERHIRLLTPLAFVSPRIIAAVIEGTAPTDLTVTGLAKALPYSWAEQERSRHKTPSIGPKVRKLPIGDSGTPA